MKEKKEAFGLYTVAMVGLMAALVFAGSKLEIRIPAILGVTRIHLGNSMCLLSGFLLGTVPGGIAAGLGSFLFDVIFWPGTPVDWLITFCTKFAMGAVAGFLAEKRPLGHRVSVPAFVLYGAAGALTYVVLYLLQSFVSFYFVLGNPTTEKFLDAWYRLLDVAMPGYVAEGKSHLSIAVGCTGGQHRSVAIASATAAYLEKSGYHVSLSHRDLALANVRTS